MAVGALLPAAKQRADWYLSGLRLRPLPAPRARRIGMNKHWVWIAASAALLAAAPALAAGELVHRKLMVAAINDDWTRTSLSLEAGQLVIIMASGSAKVRPYGDGVGPQGLDNGAGRLEGKIGQAPAFTVGTSIAFYAKEPGPLKLRIKDSRYDDNVGGYTIDLMVLDPVAIPPATDVPVASQ